MKDFRHLCVVCVCLLSVCTTRTPHAIADPPCFDDSQHDDRVGLSIIDPGGTGSTGIDVDAARHSEPNLSRHVACRT